jgi:hypothetical protein
MWVVGEHKNHLSSIVLIEITNQIFGISSASGGQYGNLLQIQKMSR